MKMLCASSASGLVDLVPAPQAPGYILRRRDGHGGREFGRESTPRRCFSRRSSATTLRRADEVEGLGLGQHYVLSVPRLSTERGK